MHRRCIGRCFAKHCIAFTFAFTFTFTFALRLRLRLRLPPQARHPPWLGVPPDPPPQQSRPSPALHSHRARGAI